MSVELTYELCGRLASVWVMVGAVEVLVSLREFRPAGIFDRGVVRTGGGTLGAEGEGPTLDLIAVAAVAALRVAAGLALLLSPWSVPVQTAAWTAVAGCAFYMRWRRQLGDDGADQMLMIMSVAFAASLWLHSAPGSLEAGACFVGAQACLSYAVAGIAKLIGPDWRRGNVIPLILATRSYGTLRLARMLRGRPLLTKLLCWGTIALETTFLVAPLLPLPVLLALLAIACFFHVGNAAFMGLNGFLWAFVATFPAIVFLNQAVHAVI
jgi:hypothetical protein